MDAIRNAATKPLLLSAWLTSRALCTGQRKAERPSLAVYLANGLAAGGLAHLAWVVVSRFW